MTTTTLIMKPIARMLATVMLGSCGAVAASDAFTAIPCKDAQVEVVVSKAGAERIRDRFSPTQASWSLESRDGEYQDPGTIRISNGKTHTDPTSHPTGIFLRGASLCHEEIILVKATVEQIALHSVRDERIGDATVSFPKIARRLFDSSFVWKLTRLDEPAEARMDDLTVSMRLVLP